MGLGTLESVSSSPSTWLVEVCTHTDGTSALLVVHGGERYMLWPGQPTALSSRTGLAAIAGEGRDVWAEQFPAGGCLLANLRGPIPPQEGAVLFATIAQTLHQLHTSNRAHGALHAQHIALSNTGAPILLGAGQHRGTPEDDLRRFVEIWEMYCPDGPLIDPRSAQAIEAGLHLWLSVCGPPPTPVLPVRIASARPDPLPDTAPLVFSGLHLGVLLDEIGVPLGPDEVEPGLFDDRTWSGQTGETTREHTGQIEGALTSADPMQASVLFRLLQIIDQPTDPSRFQSQVGMPSEAVQILLEREPLDILPAPESTALPSPSAPRRDWDGPSETASGTTLTQPTAHSPTPRPRSTGRLLAGIAIAGLALTGVAIGIAWMMVGQ